MTAAIDGVPAAMSARTPGPVDEQGHGPCRLPKGAAAQWASIADVLGACLVRDVREAIERGPTAYTPGDLDRGARAFFGWLASSAADPVRRPVLDAYAGASATDSSSSGTDTAVLFAINACFPKFCDELPAVAAVSGSTVWMRQRCAALVLERLGEVGGRRYPAFLMALHKRHRALGGTPMLGSLPFSKGIVAPPGVLRERLALDRVGLLALEEFRDHVAMIDAAIPIRVDAPFRHGTDAARECVHRALAQAWSTLPVRPAGRVRCASDLVSEAPEMAEDPATWIAAGIPDRCVRRFSPEGTRMDRGTVGRLALACLGPSPTMVIAGAAVVARGRGWNKGSILAIRAAPFAFAVQGKYGVAGGAFVTAVKARAGHPVTMFLSDARDVDEVLTEELIEEWRATAAGPGADLLGDQMLLGVEPDDAPGAAVLEVIDALMRVSKPVWLHDSLYGSMDRLFAYPPVNERDEKNTHMKFRLAESTTPALATGGANFRTIRASYVYVEYEHRRSLTATMAVSGQVTPTVTMRHYLNHREVGDEHRKALRFFQSICQALVVGNVTVALQIGLGGADLDRLRRLARAAGMAAAFGLDVPQVGPAPVLRFRPSEANLRDLFLGLWALRVAGRTLPYATWRARCLEPFAAARAIATELCSANLAADYAAAARAAYADLRAGRVSLPRVEGT